eukprot:9504164-Pyramimonas_sp.AAC.1
MRLGFYISPALAPSDSEQATLIGPAVSALLGCILDRSSDYATCWKLLARCTSLRTGLSERLEAVNTSIALDRFANDVNHRMPAHREGPWEIAGQTRRSGRGLREVRRMLFAMRAEEEHEGQGGEEEDEAGDEGKDEGGGMMVMMVMLLLLLVMMMMLLMMMLMMMMVMMMRMMMLRMMMMMMLMMMMMMVMLMMTTMRMLMTGMRGEEDEEIHEEEEEEADDEEEEEDDEDVEEQERCDDVTDADTDHAPPRVPGAHSTVDDLVRAASESAQLRMDLAKIAQYEADEALAKD